MEFPFEVTVTQKVIISTGEKVNYLSLNFEVDGAEVIASGQSQVSGKYRKDESGVGFICITDLESSEHRFQ